MKIFNWRRQSVCKWFVNLVHIWECLVQYNNAIFIDTFVQLKTKLKLFYYLVSISSAVFKCSRTAQWKTCVYGSVKFSSNYGITINLKFMTSGRWVTFSGRLLLLYEFFLFLIVLDQLCHRLNQSMKVAFFCNFKQEQSSLELAGSETSIPQKAPPHLCMFIPPL